MTTPSSGTTSTRSTQLFTSNMNANSIRSEYSAIATGNVTTTIDRLHTAQAQPAVDAERRRAAADAQATATRNGLQQSESQAGANWPTQDRQTLAGVDANIQQLVAQQQAAAAAAAQAAATAAFNQKVQAAQAAAAARAAQSSAGSTADTSGSGSGGGAPTVSNAPLPPLAPGAAGAVQAAEHEIGVPYVWGGDTPAGFDCSGLVQWAYAQVGISLPHYSGAQYAATVHIPLADIEPGDLLFYGPGGDEHVAMYVGGGSMIEAPLYRGVGLDHRRAHGRRVRRRRPGRLSRSQATALSSVQLAGPAQFSSQLTAHPESGRARRNPVGASARRCRRHADRAGGRSETGWPPSPPG